jgi:hypothetical protein
MSWAMDMPGMTWGLMAGFAGGDGAALLLWPDMIAAIWGMLHPNLSASTLYFSLGFASRMSQMR